LVGLGAGLTAGLTAAVLLAGCTPDGEVPPATESTAAAAARLHVVVYGPTPVAKAWKRIADGYTAVHPQVTVEVSTYPTETAALAAVRADAAAGTPPDLFLSGIDSLAGLMADQLIQPVSDLLEDRQVDFGDGYARGAVEAYSKDAALQCMPVGYSPLVVYYNTALVNLTAAQGDSPTPIAASGKWTMEQFTAAVQMAAHDGRRGVFVEPTVEQVGPFLSSAGGGVVDNPVEPTSLTLAAGGSLTGLTQLLTVVRDRKVALPASTSPAVALRDFESGRLAMILGYRDLTGVLRAHAKVPFNVLPVPRIGTSATSGQTSGMCLSAGTAHPAAAADLLADMVSEPAMRILARTGYVMPTNLAALSSDDFWQPTRMPASASVFTDQVRNIVAPPVAEAWTKVEKYADSTLGSVLSSGSPQPDAAILKARMQLVDTVSQRMFTPPTPSATPVESSSPSAQ